MLLTGPNGFVGPRLVPALVEAGHDVAALVRDAARYEAPNGGRVVEGDRLEVPKGAGETYEIGGPDVLTYQTMLERSARAMGRRPVIVPVPVLSPVLSVCWGAASRPSRRAGPNRLICELPTLSS